VNNRRAIESAVVNEEEEMNLLAALVLAHLIADFPLQTNKIFEIKQKGGVGILPHVFIHFIVTALLIQNPWQQLPLLLSLGVIHYLIDWYKIKTTVCCTMQGFLTDQLAHFISLVGLAAVFSGIEITIPEYLLYSCVFYAFLPAIMMASWVYADTHEGKSSKVLRWVQAEMLLMSQGAGLIIAFYVGYTTLMRFQF
jgi:hypothetical protein